MKIKLRPYSFILSFQVVDTSQLIKDERDIFNSPNSKVACFAKGEQLHNLILSFSSPKNVLTRIFKEKTMFGANMKERELFKDGRCLISLNPKMADLMNSPIFAIAPRTTANFFLVLFHMLQGVFKEIWVTEKPIYEFRLVIYYTSLRKKGNKERFNRM